ncbi:MAG TPA: superoxide dismutase [Tepidisphaeraceae bacterium]|jgi:Fe-Mn family superoxide dismutase
MSDALSRRDLITRTAPAVALGAAMMSTNVFGQDAGLAASSSVVIKMLTEAQKDGSYVLPKLPYAYDALEPHIDAQTMELHHSKHQQAYVSGINDAIKNLAKIHDEQEIDAARLSALSRNISFNAGGHLFHTVFFGTMAKSGGQMDASSSVATAITSQFGSVDKFKAHFSKVAAGVKGSGWAIAFYEPVGDRILITETGDQDLRIIPGAIPILLIDVWEHAYYLKYQNKRADYITAWWNVVNWTEVNALYQHARKMSGRA